VKPAAATTRTAVAMDDALLRFPMKPYQPRAAAPSPAREPGVPQSIKDAIIRWLDEQL
jgi:hypothetical protein